VGGALADVRTDPLGTTNEPVPDYAEIFWTFSRIAMLSFGGAAAWVQHVLVNEKHWLTDREFAEELSLCQVLPGPNITNLAVIIGTRFRGGRGATVAVTALIGPPAALVTLLGVLYASIGAFPVVRGALAGLSAAAAGLFIVLVLRLLIVVWQSYPREVLLFTVLAFVSVAAIHVPLVLAMLTLAPLSIARAWWRRR
jgi:chromate transporter